MNKVLVVDDNPMIRGLLEQALAPLAQVSSCATAADALVRAVEDPPDLIISDYRMPGMDGCQLLNKLKSRPATARIPVMLAATRADMAERLKPVEDSVEDFLEKPFFAKDAAARVKRVLHKIALERMSREATGDSIVRGSLAQMNVIDLLQSLELGRKTCGLVLARGPGERCAIFFTEGQINHAEYGELKGDDAVYRTLAWTEPAGSFEINFAAHSAEQTITRSTQGLLMEGLRLLDEANRDAGKEP